MYYNSLIPTGHHNSINNLRCQWEWSNILSILSAYSLWSVSSASLWVWRAKGVILEIRHTTNKAIRCLSIALKTIKRKDTSIYCTSANHGVLHPVENQNKRVTFRVPSHLFFIKQHIWSWPGVYSCLMLCQWTHSKVFYFLLYHTNQPTVQTV